MRPKIDPRILDLLDRMSEPREVEWKRLCKEYGWPEDTPMPPDLPVVTGRKESEGLGD